MIQINNKIISLLLRGKLLILPLLFLGSFFLMGTGYARAYTIENYQENVEDRFVISPVNLELTLAPGETTTQNIIIVNRLGKTADFQISKEDFVGSQDPEKATSFLGDESAGITTAKDWITADVDQISLNHGDRLNMPIKITAPENAVAGSHYAAIFASVSGGESGTGNAKVKLVSRVGTLILINIPGNNRESGGITDFSSDKKYYRQGPVDFSTTFQNTGNVYAKVRGEIAIKNILGTEIAHVPLKDWTVLSDSVRSQAATWDRKWLLGRYTADLTVFYGLGGNLKDTKSLIFYAFPWHIALLILLILIVIYYLLKYFFSKFEIKKKE
jgi:hypothetical protein